MVQAGNAAGYSASVVSSNQDAETYNSHEQWDPLIGRTLSSISEEPVFPLVQRVKSEVTEAIDTALAYQQLHTPTFNFSIVRPLTLKLGKLGLGTGERPPAPLLYALLLCRVHFLDVAGEELAFAGVNTTRADLCELLAVKLLAAYSGAPASLDLLHVITASFNPFFGATADMFSADENVDQAEVEAMIEWGESERSNALELAIFTKAKRFVRAPLVQQVVKAIYTGEVLYSPESAHTLIKDDYKTKPVVEVYDWRKQPFLDYHRLRVPRIRNRLEFITFASIIVLFIVAQRTHDPAKVTLWEALFVLFSLGFALDEWAALLENGFSAYSTTSYNVLDGVFVIIFVAFMALRAIGLATGDLDRSELAFDTMSLAGCVLFPRLTISLIRGNVVLLALGEMLVQFCWFMLLASLTASGFLCTLWILARGSPVWDIGHISWLMLKIWLGNSFLGFEAAQDFHEVYGPLLIVAFAILSQTLLITILISLLSNTFAAVQQNAESEILHQFSLRTIERVKSDALTSYMPPLNLFAFVVLLPVRFIASPRWLHKTHVMLTKVFNFPVLLFLAITTRVEHRRGLLFKAIVKTQRAWQSLPKGITWDGTSEAVSRVFERETTDLALVVPSIDDSAFESPSGSPQPRTARPSGAATSRVRALTRSQSLQARMGSLASPLAKVFAVQGGLNTSGSAGTMDRGRSMADVVQGKASSTEVGTSSGVAASSRGIEVRLDAIEAALAILVGEIAKSQDDTKVEKPPLTSLTGEIEQVYDD